MTILFWQPITQTRFSTYDLIRASEIPMLQTADLRITFDRNEYSNADVVVFNLPLLYWHKEMSLPQKRAGQLWVVWSLESEVNHPWVKSERAKGVFDIYMSFYKGSDIVTPYFNNFYVQKIRTMPSVKSKDVCMFISSGFNNSGRMEYVKELMQHLNIDSYGQFMNNCTILNDKGYTSKLEVMRDYKFCIAFENAIDTDYVTEKFYEPLMVGTVPIYMGAPNIAEFAPDNSAYLNVNDFGSPKELADTIKRICTNDSEYAKFFEWKTEPLNPDFKTHIKAQELHPFLRLASVAKECMNRPLVSVVIPAYGEIKELGTAIESALKQSYQNIEVLVIDDGSNEDAVKLLTDQRISYNKHSFTNANAVRNAGIVASKGLYVAFLDADDQWLPAHLDNCLKSLLSSSSDGVYSGLIIRDAVTKQDHKVVVTGPLKDETMVNYLLRVGHGAQTSTLFMTAESAKAVMWDESLNRHQDYDFVVRYSKKYRFAVKSEPTTIHLIRHKAPQIDFRSCIRFIEHNKSDISIDVLRKYTEGMLKAATALKADKDITDHYNNQLAQINSMPEINLYLMNIENHNTSGVSRYLESLKQGLRKYPHIRVHTVKFMMNNSVTMFKDEGNRNYTVGVTPKSEEMLTTHKECLFYLMREIFRGKNNIVLHLHTLNLIDFALYIKTQMSCKVVSHIHCVPWRGLFNSDIKKFNQLHDWWSKGISDRDLFYIQPFEAMSYGCSDELVCVTENGREFVSQTMKMSAKDIEVIPNGLGDLFEEGIRVSTKAENDTYNLLFAGTLLPSKGLTFVLDAVQKVVKAGYKVGLKVAGRFPDVIQKELTDKYPTVDVELLGMLPFDKLQQYYRQSDIGIIASLQEQCSYVAIEMAMFGLPIITTAIDGLNEMFDDNKTALKVPTTFSKEAGLGVDTDDMAQKIITLIKDRELRNELSKNVRKAYKERFSVDDMIEKTVKLYNIE